MSKQARQAPADRVQMNAAVKGNSEMELLLERGLLDEITVLHRQFKKLYGAGVISVNRESIQVTKEFFQNIPGKVYEKNRRKGSSHPFSVHKIYQGLEFFALLKQPYEGDAGSEKTDTDQ